MVDEKRTNEDWKQTSFNLFLSSLVIQAMIFLGEMENPVTKKIEENLDQASFLIDTLGMLKEKTKGNLTQEEERLLEDALYDLRVRYVNKVKESSEKV